MMEQVDISLEKIFRSCSFLAQKRANKANKSNDSEPAGDPNEITSFFVDSSGRSSFTVPLQMTFENKKDLDDLLAAKVFDPPPCDFISDGEYKESNERYEASSSISFEVKSAPSNSDDNNQVTVEGVSIVSCSVKDLIVNFETKVTVRATTRGPLSASVPTSADSSTPISPSRFSSSPLKYKTARDEPELEEEQQLQRVNLSACFNITPVLTIESSMNENKNKNQNEASRDDFSPDLTLLGLAAIPDQMQYTNTTKTASSILSSSNDTIRETRLSPVSIQVTLTNAFFIRVQSVPGRMGNTLVSLLIEHSKTHNLPVTITNVALHPGHSRHDVIVARSNKKNEGPPIVQQAVSNMTEIVEWGYASKAELKLPLTLHPYEAYSSIMSVSAGEERSSRQFLSPLSVTGVIGMNANNEEDNSETKADDDNENRSREQCRVVVASDVCWTTKPIAVEPADAFRIDMCSAEPTVQRGEPMVIKLRIFNLSLESRNLMIFMAKQDQGASIRNRDLLEKHKSVNSAVVTASDGYTFGVWGISGDDDGTVRLNRDHELLAIDTALVLGEVQGQHAVDTELRFVPLSLGRLKVPNWKLYDKAANRWYSCNHDLNIVVV